MSFKTLKVSGSAIGDLFACDDLYVDNKHFNVDLFNDKLKYQSASNNQTIFTSYVKSDTLQVTSTVSGSVAGKYLKTNFISPLSDATVAINGNFDYTTFPDESAGETMQCQNMFLTNTSATSQTLCKIYRAFINNGESYLIKVGTGGYSTSMNIGFNYVGLNDATNRATIAFQSQSLRISVDDVRHSNLLHIGASNISTTVIPPYISSLTKMTSSNKWGPQFSIDSASLGYVNEIEMTISNVPFGPKGGSIYLVAGQTAGTTSTLVQDIESFSGVIYNSTLNDDEGSGVVAEYKYSTPASYPTTKKASWSWKATPAAGPTIFISKDGDFANNITNTINSGTLKMYRLGIDATTNKEYWSYMFMGYLDTMASVTKFPYWYSVGTFVTKAATKLRYFRFVVDQNYSGTLEANVLLRSGSSFSFLFS